MNHNAMLGERTLGHLRKPVQHNGKPRRVMILTPEYREFMPGTESQHLAIISLLQTSFTIAGTKSEPKERTAAYPIQEIPLVIDGILNTGIETLVIINAPAIAFRALGLLARIDTNALTPTLFYCDGHRGTLGTMHQGKRITFASICNYLPDVNIFTGTPASVMHEATSALVLRLIDLARHHGLPTVGMSAAATSYQCWLQTCQLMTPVVHDDADALALERDAYTTGWTEALYHGLTPGSVHCWDVQSAYPWIASTSPMPLMLKHKMAACEPKQFLLGMENNLCDPSCLFARVQIKSDVTRYPVRIDGETKFCIGSFATSLCGRELLGAIDDGDITHVYQGHGYTSGCYLRNYLGDMLYNRELSERAGQTDIAMACKLLANALIGKFGQRGDFWEFIGASDHSRPWQAWSVIDEPGHIPLEFRTLGTQIQRRYAYHETQTSIPAIPAIVNANMRREMQTLVRLVDKPYNGQRHTYHVATDALHVDDIGHSRLQELLTRKRPGPGTIRYQWSVKQAEYWGPNTYMRDGQLTAPGLFKIGKRDGMTWTTQRIAELGSHLDAKGVGIIPVSTGHYTVYRRLAPCRIRPDKFLEPEKL